MAKRSKVLKNEEKAQEGRGLGQGQDYKPWITIQDFPSSGRVSRIRGIKTKRQHEFLSDLERNYFYFLDFSDKVIDIREQYPLLPLEETLFIAKELGIQHPEHPQTKEPIVMTTDFLITLKTPMGGTKEIARTIKYKDKLLEQRVLEKFEIERLYFEKREIDWGIVTQEEINKQTAQNLADFHAYQNLTEIEAFSHIEPLEFQDIKDEFVRRSIDYQGSLRGLCSKFDKDIELVKGSAVALLKHLIINKVLAIDFNESFDLSKHIEMSLKDNETSRGVEIG